jgi:hypothetical protein
MQWPPPELRDCCAHAWRVASAAERRDIIGINCGCAVVYLKIAEALLVSRSTLEEILEARRRFRLEGTQWKMEPPRHALPGPDVCEDDGFIDFVLDLCTASLDEVLLVIKHARSPLVPVDRMHRRLASGRASTWEAFAREFWSVLLFDMVLHMKAASDRWLCLEVVKDLVERPVSVCRTRSWPSPRLYRQLKEEWGTLSVEDKVRLTTMTPCEYWFIQACDLVTAASTFKWLKSTDIRPHQDAAIFQPQIQGLLLSNLRVEVGPELYLMMSDDFVQRRDALDLLHQMAVQSLAEKNEIVRLVYCCRFESIFEGEKIAGDFQISCSWKKVERIAATLLLDHLLERLAHMQAIKRFKHLAAEEEAFAKACKKETASRKRKSRLRERKRGCEPPDGGGGGDSSLEKEAEEDWREATRALLERSPCWDISCLQVRHTFLEYRTPRQQLVAQHRSRDW